MTQKNIVTNSKLNSSINYADFLKEDMAKSKAGQLGFYQAVDTVIDGLLF